MRRCRGSHAFGGRLGCTGAAPAQDADRPRAPEMCVSLIRRVAGQGGSVRVAMVPTRLNNGCSGLCGSRPLFSGVAPGEPRTGRCVRLATTRGRRHMGASSGQRVMGGSANGRQTGRAPRGSGARQHRATVPPPHPRRERAIPAKRVPNCEASQLAGSSTRAARERAVCRHANDHRWRLHGWQRQ